MWLQSFEESAWWFRVPHDLALASCADDFVMPCGMNLDRIKQKLTSHAQKRHLQRKPSHGSGGRSLGERSERPSLWEEVSMSEKWILGTDCRHVRRVENLCSCGHKSFPRLNLCTVFISIWESLDFQRLKFVKRSFESTLFYFIYFQMSGAWVARPRGYRLALGLFWFDMLESVGISIFIEDLKRLFFGNTTHGSNHHRITCPRFPHVAQHLSRCWSPLTTHQQIQWLVSLEGFVFQSLVHGKKSFVNPLEDTVLKPLSFATAFK